MPSWKWFGVKTLYRVSAEGEPRATDERFDGTVDLIEERVVLIRARSCEEAHRKAAQEAYTYAADFGEHVNPYGQRVHCRFIECLVAYECFDDPVPNAEIFSDTFLIDREMTDDSVVTMRLDTEESVDLTRRTIFMNEEHSGRVEPD